MGWADAEGGSLAEGLAACAAESRACESRTSWCSTGLSKIALAEAEAAPGDLDRAIAILDEALATFDRTGFRAFEAELHRVRGEILLKRDAANLAPRKTPS